MDAHHLELDDGIFDVVLGNGILHHLPNLQAAVSEISRVLKASGYAVFTEPLGMNPIINIFRKRTPDCRTEDEKPFTMQELEIIKQSFPNTQFTFFECTTLIAKALHLLKLSALAKKLQRPLIKIDNAILNTGKSDKITFVQKMSWVVLIKMVKM